MAQRQFASGDTSTWTDKYGSGSDGALPISDDTADSARTGYANTTFAGTETESTGTAGSGTGFSAGDLVLIHQSRNGGDGAGVWELNKITSTGAGTNWTMAYALTHDYATTGQVYRLAQNSAITIDNTKTLTGVAWNGTQGGIVALLCNGTTTVSGNISVNGKGFRGSTTHQSVGDEGADWSGEGTNGASANSQSANGNGGGGGDNEGSNLARGSGGGGGNGEAGTAGTAFDGGVAGAAGTVAGNISLTTIVFGGAGGGQVKGDGSIATGGDGGGIILIISKVIAVTGSITNNGG